MRNKIKFTITLIFTLILLSISMYLLIHTLTEYPKIKPIQHIGIKK